MKRIIIIALLLMPGRLFAQTEEEIEEYNRSHHDIIR